MTDVLERIIKCQAIVGDICRDGRPPRMSIPVQPDDEDVFISDTLNMARDEITALRNLLGHAKQDIRPYWWPYCPYPESLFPMDIAQYPKMVSDPQVRTALSGALGRHFWNLASDAIWENMRQIADESPG